MKPIEELGISPAPWTVAIDRQPNGNEIISVVSSDVEVARCYSVKEATMLAAAKKMYEALYGILEIVCVDCKSSYKVKGVCVGCSRVVAARKALAEASGEVSNG